MQRLKIDQDIKPLSEVRTGIANFNSPRTQYIKKIPLRSKRP